MVSTMNLDLQEYLNQFLPEFCLAGLILKIKYIPN